MINYRESFKKLHAHWQEIDKLEILEKLMEEFFGCCPAYYPIEEQYDIDRTLTMGYFPHKFLKQNPQG